MRKPLRSGHVILGDEVFIPGPKQLNASRNSADRLRKFLVAALVCRSHLLIDFSQSGLLAGHAGTSLHHVLAQVLGRALSGFSVCHVSLDGASQASDVSHALKLHISTPSPHPSTPKSKTADDRGGRKPRARRVGGCFSHSYTTPISKQAATPGSKSSVRKSWTEKAIDTSLQPQRWHEGLVVVLQDLDCAGKRLQNSLLQMILSRTIPGTLVKLPTPFVVVGVVGRRVRTRPMRAARHYERPDASSPSPESDEGEVEDESEDDSHHSRQSKASIRPMLGRFRRSMHRHMRSFQTPETIMLYRWLQNQFLFRFSVPSLKSRARGGTDPRDSSSSMPDSAVARGYSSNDSGGRPNFQPRAVQLYKALVPHSAHPHISVPGARAAVGGKDYDIRHFPLPATTIVSLMHLRKQVFLSSEVEQFVADLTIALSTVDSQAFMLSPHARKHLAEGLQGMALLEGQMFVTSTVINETTLEVLGPRLVRRSHAYAPSPLAGLAGTPTPTLTQQYKANQVIVSEANAVIRDVIAVIDKLR